MKLLRPALAITTVVLLGVGYAASQYHFFNGTTAQYIKTLDESPVPILALVLLGLVIAVGLKPPPPEEDEA